MSVVIIGGGQAAHHLAVSLKQSGYKSSVTIACDEWLSPYQRPPLSKTFLTADIDSSRLALAGDDTYGKAGIRVRLGERVTSVDRLRKRVLTDHGTELPYTTLVFATGARNRSLDMGEDVSGIHSIRTVTDALVLRESLPQATNVVIVGGGLLGLEFACAARGIGCSVTVIEKGDRVLARVIDAELSAMVSAIHVAAGIQIKTSASITAVMSEHGRLTGVECSDSTQINATLSVVSVGVAPNDALAASAGLDTGDGILVDDRLRTTDDSIFAIGDCARIISGNLAQAGRSESVQNAIDQANYVSRTLTSSIDTPFMPVPTFWSKQGSAMIHVVGNTDSFNEVIDVKLNTESRYKLFVLDGKLNGVQCINSFRQFREIKRLLETHSRVLLEDLVNEASRASVTAPTVAFALRSRAFQWYAIP